MKHTTLAIGMTVAVALGASIGLTGCNDEQVEPQFESASYACAVKKGEVYSADAEYTPLEIFGRLNATFARKTDWYAVYNGTVETLLPQNVTTLKQFHDGVLLSTDISTSMLLNTAKEFCYLPAEDRVMWREATSSTASTFNGFDTPWKEELVKDKEGSTVGSMQIGGTDGFKETNGLPAYELSVYLFNEETISSADSVVTNEKDGTFTITYHLNVEKAAVYYSKQMTFTSGGMATNATFTEITVSFTFNAQWEILMTETREVYSTTTAIGAASCTGTGMTTYSYNKETPPFAECDHYETFFKSQL